MKKKHNIVAVVLVLMAMMDSAAAKLPELDAVYFGRLRHNSTDLAVPTVANQIAIIAKLDGLEIARAVMNVGSAQYLLKVPLDDGNNPRLPKTGRFGEGIRIYVVKISDGSEYEPSESTSGLTLSSVKGDVQTLNLTISEDLGLPLSNSLDGFSEWLISHGLDPANITDTTDSDNDGVYDIDEFVADTDPTDLNSKLGVVETRHENGVFSVKFGPVRISRIYRIYCSPTMQDGTWNDIGLISSGENLASIWHDHTTTAPQCFYRITVEIE